jgi:hypothetical protein
MSWVPLPSGDITLKPGAAYAVIASVRLTHSKADLLAAAAQKGLHVYDFAEQSDRPALGVDPDNGYRFIALAAMASAVGSIPWEVPFPLSLADSSHVVRAWVDESPQQATPTLPASNPTSNAPVWILGGLIVVTGIAWYATKR